MATVPQIDLRSPQLAPDLDRACRDVGFFTLTGHGVPDALLDSMDAAARTFFAQPDDVKAGYAMARAGKAWRGWFPVGGELTAGVPDRKEGLYFGSEDDPADPRPLHGANLFPPGFREPVLSWMAAMTDLGQHLLDLLAAALGLGTGWFRSHVTTDPTTLFRIFHYPSQPPGSDGWGVAEHTDYGLLTLLAQDGTSGLQVRAADGAWLDVPPDRDVLVCNLGDMLEKLTGGRYRSTPHRVRNDAARGRLSFPFFLDPSWDATMATVETDQTSGQAGPPPDRWDGADPTRFEGTYGDYLTAKVRQVFPALAETGDD